MGIDHSNPYIHSTTVLCDILPSHIAQQCIIPISRWAIFSHIAQLYCPVSLAN